MCECAVAVGCNGNRKLALHSVVGSICYFSHRIAGNNQVAYLTSNVGVHLVNGLVLRDLGFENSGNISVVFASIELCDVVHTILVVAWTVAGVHGEHIVTGLAHSNLLVHVKCFVPSFCSNHVVLSGISLGSRTGYTLPSVESVGKLSIGQQSGNLTAGHVTIVDGCLQPCLQTCNFSFDFLYREQHIVDNIEVSTARIQFAGFFVTL